MQVTLDTRVINAFYDLPPMIEYKYTKFDENMTVKKWGEFFRTLTVQGSEWMNKEERVVNRIDLKPIAKVWVKFLKLD